MNIIAKRQRGTCLHLQNPLQAARLGCLRWV